MIVMCLFWVLIKNIVVPIPAPAPLDFLNESTPLIPRDAGALPHRSRVYDIVDIQAIDLYSDEYPDDPVDAVEDETKETRFQLFWKLYNMLA